MAQLQPLNQAVAGESDSARIGGDSRERMPTPSLRLVIPWTEADQWCKDASLSIGLLSLNGGERPISTR